MFQSETFFRKAVSILETMPGVGPVIQAVLLADLPERGRLDYKQIAKLAGVAPLNADSGSLRGKRRSWGGRKNVRNSRYRATMSARLRDALLSP